MAWLVKAWCVQCGSIQSHSCYRTSYH
jgi:hypothetical protein